MRKKIIQAVKLCLVILIPISIYIIIGLYHLSIEDYNGGFEKFFYESKQGDIIVNKTKKEYGTIEKSKTKIWVKLSTGEKIMLFNWGYGKNAERDQLEVYRINTKDKNFTYSEITKLIKDSNASLIVKSD